jgi:hypothetical protein
MKVSKKGVSLAFVIVVVLALLIFSSVLCTAATRSLSLTAESTDGREAYLKAKSAIEYAKTQFYINAKSGNCNAFSVVASGDGFAAGEDRSPDGTSCLAQCSSADNGQTWKITAKVKYRNSDLFRTLSYSFRLTPQSSQTVIGFLSAGGKLGGSEYIHPDGEFGSSPDYPIVIKQSVFTTQPCTAPEMYFINPKSEYCFKTKGNGTYNLKLTAHFFYFDGTIRADTLAQDSNVSLTLHGIPDSSTSSITKLNYAGLVYFHNAKIEIPHTEESYKLNGLYYFKENTDLFNKRTASLSDSQLVQVPEADQQSKKLTLGGKTLAEYYAEVQYMESNADAVVDAKQIGWLQDTKFNAGNHSNPEKDVCIYTDDQYYDEWRNVNKPSISYQARSIFLLKQSSNTIIQIPNTSVNLQTGTFWFCAQKTASYPWAPSSVTGESPTIKSFLPNDVPCIKTEYKNGKCILNSPDGTDVTLILPRGLAIQEYNHSNYLLLPAGTYSVTSGTDLLTLPSDWQIKLKKKSESVPGGGGFNITPLGYSNS